MTREVFQCLAKKAFLFVLTDIEYPFEHGEVINYTLDGVSKHPVTTKIQESLLTQWPERNEIVILKQLQSLMALIGEN